MYVNTDDIKKLVDNAIDATCITEKDTEDTVRYMFGILRGYLYAIQDILIKEEN